MIESSSIDLLIAAYAKESPKIIENARIKTSTVIMFVIKILFACDFTSIPRFPQMMSPGSGAFRTTIIFLSNLLYENFIPKTASMRRSKREA